MVMTAEQLRNHFDTALANLHDVLTNQKTEIVVLGQTKEQTSHKIGELEKNLEELGNELKEIVRRNSAMSGNDSTPRKSLGQQYIESNEYKVMMEHKMLASAPMMVSRLLPSSRFALTTDVDGTGASVASPPSRVPGFVSPMMPPLRMRDLIPVRSTTQGSIEYVRTTGFFPVYAHLSAATAVADTALIVTSTAGFVVGQQVIVGSENRTIASVTDATHMAVTTGLTSAHAIATRVVSRYLGSTPQGGMKPTGDFENFTLENEAVKTIATSVDVARQALDDVGQLRGFIDNQLVFEMGYAEEWNILYGNGTASNQLHGILTDPDIQPYLWSNGKKQVIGTTTVVDTQIDALRRALTLVTLARYPADGIVIHPHDWEDFELMKGSDGKYIWLSLPDGNGSTSFFRVPAVVTDAIQQGTALTGSFALGTALWDRELANVRASDQHGTNFKQNLVTLLAEERIAQTVFRPEAFVKVTFDHAPT
jgi:HK97 family phage major capsid protein